MLHRLFWLTVGSTHVQLLLGDAVWAPTLVRYSVHDVSLAYNFPERAQKHRVFQFGGTSIYHGSHRDDTVYLRSGHKKPFRRCR